MSVLNQKTNFCFTISDLVKSFKTDRSTIESLDKDYIDRNYAIELVDSDLVTTPLEGATALDVQNLMADINIMRVAFDAIAIHIAKLTE